ncbi:unnamed protein product [Pieris macdunnoughi]|uniref:Tc1-like transposase DDE domain-containing protein n=1 Tax=Pieris macdunnoughi TaxID=345717 RepID=A0A821TCL1_9NEOP|nr:unnamed protein product [Pieris macdunnoughi]
MWYGHSVFLRLVPDCDDEYPDDVGEPSAACTDPSASSRTHEPHIGDHGEQDAVLPKKRSPVHPRTVHGQERPYKYVYCDDEYPDDVGEPSAACTDPSASSRTHEPHICDHGEQDAVLPKKRSPVYPRMVHGQERPYKYVWTANVVRSWCVPEVSNLEKRASADVHPVRVADAVPEDVFFELISGAVLVHIANEGTFPSSNCDDEYPDEVGEPSAACTDPSASSRIHEPHIGDYGEQDAVLPKKRLPVYPRTVHGQERPYKNHSGWFRSPPAFYKRKASVCHGLCCCSDVDKKGGWCRRRILRPGERYSAAAVQEYDKFGCGSVIVWGGVSLDERTDLVVVPGRLCAQTYIENVLEDHVWPAACMYGMGPDFLLMQDNARPHTAAITSDYLRQQEIRVMEWPSISPDLNPIEHIWDLLDRRIRKRPIAPQTLQQLTEALIEEWERIPQEDIRRIIRSMPRRCQAVIRAHGGYTRY